MRDRHPVIGADEVLLDDSLVRNRGASTHKMPDSEKMMFSKGNGQLKSCPENPHVGINTV